MYKRLIMILFVLMMSMILVPSAMAETGASDNGEEISAEEAVAAFEELDKGEYAPGEVIVLFEEDAVREREPQVCSEAGRDRQQFRRVDAGDRRGGGSGGCCEI